MSDAPITTDFVIYSTRAAVADGLLHIERQVIAIENAVVGNPAWAFDLAKVIVESTCKTILRERNIPFNTDDDMPRLFRTLTTVLPILPEEASHETEARKSLQRTLGGMQSALQGLCELRNGFGFSSHGADGPRPTMESVQALLAAQSADAIVGFLHRVHRQDTARRLMSQVEYDDNEEFNVYVDEVNDEVRIFELGYRPSEVLFKVDHEAYRDQLAGYSSAEGDEFGTDAISTATGAAS